MNDEHGGYIRLYWGTKDSLQGGNAESLGLWAWLLMSACAKRKVLPSGHILERGELLISVKRLSERLSMSEKTINRYIKLWVRDKAISVLKRDRNGTHLSVCNWGTYQTIGSEAGSQTQRNGIETASKENRNGIETGSQRRHTENPEIPDTRTQSPEVIGAEDQFAEVWNATEGVKPCRSVSASRKRALRARLSEMVVLDDERRLPWLEALRVASATKFPLRCTRGSPDGWKPDADWILKPANLPAVFEGKYDWSKSDGKQPSRIGPGQRFDPEAVGSTEASANASDYGF